MRDVLVLGAGLAGLACARDLAAGGADVLVLEARDRAGGRVEAERLADGRMVQLGGELAGRAHRHYRELAGELGLELEPSYVSEPGEVGYDLREGVVLGDGWLDAADRASLDRFGDALTRLAGGLDPADPWSHPDAARLDRLSVGDLLRDTGATPNAYRLVQLHSFATAAGSVERLSALAEARAEAALGRPMTDYDAWEGLRLAAGAAALPAALAAGLGARIRLAAPVVRVDVGRVCRVELAGGEALRSETVVCTVPAGPLRQVDVRGLSPERLRSLHRLRHARASKAVAVFDRPRWREVGWSGSAVSERDLGGFWAQSAHALSALFGPDQLGYLEAAPDGLRDEAVQGALGRIGGPLLRAEQVLWRHWGTDPWTLGYSPQWAPGDLTAVGPLHGAHEPPFYVAGSDHWVAGYMEGAVATGRAAGRALLRDRDAHAVRGR